MHYMVLRAASPIVRKVLADGMNVMEYHPNET